MESTHNVMEIVYGVGLSPVDGVLKLRNLELPFIDGYKIMGKQADNPVYIIIRTPWAEQDKMYAVAADDENNIDLFYSAVGKPVEVFGDMPFKGLCYDTLKVDSGKIKPLIWKGCHFYVKRITLNIRRTHKSS
jgi:hypothetical protein